MQTATVRYDELYSGHYREQLTGFELARWEAIRHFVTRVLALPSGGTILDYGAGIGLYTKLWEDVFPDADLHFCDVSAVAGEKFKLQNPTHAHQYSVLRDGICEYPDNSFDVVLSVEVMEHVEDLSAYLGDILRVLKPSGTFVWTTPCANSLSIEHVYGVLTRQVDATNEGYRRWRWEDPTHVRRLKTAEAEHRLRKAGFSDVTFRLRSHLFSFIFSAWPLYALERLAPNMIKIDYMLFRKLPNGASMLGAGKKPAASA